MLNQDQKLATPSPAPQVDPAEEQNKKGIALEVPKVTLPQGGGAIKGIDEQFKMNPSNGTASFRVQLPVSTGRNETAPALSLNYNSGSGNSVVGIGWGLEFPSIQVRTDKKLPTYAAAQDTFLFSGAEELVPTMRWSLGAWEPDEDMIAGHRVQRYRPRLESHIARIERISQGGQVWWRTTTRDNRITYYGTTTASRIYDPGDETRIFQWLPDFSLDDRGNCIQFTYKPEDFLGVSPTLPERNRLNGLAPTTNRYLKRIRHGNATPCYREALNAFLPPAYAGVYRFETVLDYGEHHATVPTPAEVPGQAWVLRPDPFSTYRSGFEVRTYRLLRRVLMFHTFPGLAGGQPCLVRSMDLGYTPSGMGAGQDTELSYLSSLQHSGYHLLPDGQYSKKSLPALEFTYQPLDWDTTIHTLDAAAKENLPVGSDGSFQWLDFWGEGIPGIFSEQGGGWHYKRNAGDLNEDGQIHLDPTRLVAPRPSFSGLSPGGKLSLEDLDANGRKQIVVHGDGMHGFFELGNDLEWLPFRSFQHIVNRPKADPHQKTLDLNGDGMADLLLTEEDGFVWHENLGKKGYGEGQHVPKARDEERGPAIVFSDRNQTIFLADMSGDGLQDIVRVRNGDVSYWPNLGYGRFGARVAMGNPPWFTTPDLFDPGQVRLADLSGTGASDLLYLSTEGCAAWLNLSGNAWSETLPITPFMALERPNQVNVTDILGNGTSCIVWTSSLPAHKETPIRYMDLMNGKKPHLLVQYINNLGKEVHLSYKSSTWFYNTDRAAGRPWITRLPFPVHCMRRTETLDRVEGSRFVQEYSYHHGYYDPHEREFRGFGRVDQLDTETYDHWVKSGATNVVDAALHQAPLLTRTWYHLGAGTDRLRLLGQFESEYWQPEMQRAGFLVNVVEPHLPEAQLVAAPHLPVGAITGFNEVEWREAQRACKGMTLRSEVFALDAPLLNPSAAERQLQLSPFTVATHNCWVEILQPQGDNRNAVFVVKESESLTLTYDRTLADPRIVHSINVRVDELGNVLEQAQVAYGRVVPGTGLPAETVAAQAETKITYQQDVFTLDSISVTGFRLRMPSQHSAFEIKGLTKATLLYQRSDFDRIGFHVLTNSSNVPYHDYLAPPPMGTVTRRLLQQERTYYLAPDLVTPLLLNSLDPRGLVAEKYQLAFTAALLADIYVAKATALKMTEGHYVQLDGGDWWIRSGTANYLQPGEIPADASDRFFTPLSMTDPYGATTEFTYLGTDFLLLQETVDAAQNRSTALDFDFRTLMALSVQDANLNIAEVVYDELGRVKALARLGKGNEADDLIGLLGWENAAETANLAAFAGAATPSALAAAAGPLLQHATMRFVYDWDRYAASGGLLPAYSATISREQYFQHNPLSPLQLKFEYANGGGKVTMTKVQAEPGLAKQVTVNPDGSIVITTVNTALGPNPQNRWLGTGRKVLNNKGNVVKEYEPYFSVTHEYENYKELVETGKSAVTYYDALGRVMRVVHPDGTLTRAVYDRWRKEAWDRNDTALESSWYQDRILHQIDAELTAAGKDPMREAEAAAQAGLHAATPVTEYLDVQGNIILQVAHNGKDLMNVDILYRTRFTLDIQGQSRITHDPLGRDCLVTKYDMLGNPVHQFTIDSGNRWKLLNVLGEPIYEWDDRQHEFHLEYNDPLHRLSQKTVTGGDGLVAMNHVIERLIYGEGLLNDQGLNLRGQVAVTYDTAGKLEALQYNFDGKLRHSRRRFLTDYKQTVNWPALNPDALLEIEDFEHTYLHDALGRVVQQNSPDGSTYSPTYNAANLLQSVQVTRDAMTETFVHNIDYSERGQRTKIRFGNDVTADYYYDAETFRVVRIHTYRLNGEGLQDFRYTYDAVGNLTHLEDQCVPVIFWNNQKTTGLSTYTYDPLYRLTHATGREHAATLNFGTKDNWNDLPFLRELNPNDGFVWRNYSQDYTYDAVGNLTQLIHTAAMAGYTRDYSYVAGTNRLDHTTIAGQPFNYQPHPQHGFATTMPHLTRMSWNFRDELQATATQEVNAGFPETTWYVYDGTGQRLRKITDREHAQNAVPLKKEERYYLGTVELFRSYTNAGALDVERYSLHVSDDKQRIAMVDNRTQGPPGPDAHLVRYQCPNHLSSASLELDQAGRVVSYEEYHPFGTTSYQARNATITAAAKRYRFTAMERDEESGLEYHAARYYVPWLGRWLSPDKLGEKQSGNRFAYVGNNPLKFMDTNGMFEEPAHGALTYRLALAAGFTQEDAAQIAIATAAMDHDREDRPGDDINEMIEQIQRGSTQEKHYPPQAVAMARVERDIANIQPTGTQSLTQLGRDLHSLEDVGTPTNPGPHNRNPSGGPPKRGLSEAVAGVGIVALQGATVAAFFAFREGNANPGAMAGLLFLAGVLLMFALIAIVFSIQAIGTGHPDYETERKMQSTFSSHVADQIYQDPVANRKQFNELFTYLQRAAHKRYNGARDVPQNIAEQLRDEAITGAVNATTMDAIDNYMHARPRMPDGTIAPSYVEILPTRAGGRTWGARDMDITVEGDSTKYKDFYDRKYNRQNR